MSDNGDNPIDGIRLMVSQMMAAEKAGLHFPALMTALALPDICGALSSESGRSSGAKTRSWITDWMPISGSNASGIYGLRCSLLHQGSAHPDDGSPRIVFGIGPVTMHGPGATFTFEDTGESMTPIAVDAFVSEVAEAVGTWLAAHGSTELVRRNVTRFAHLRHDGVLPFISGGSFIA